ncbi:MAG: DUF1232 domain-containing protein [Acidimicrobiia bacterium]|nr:DUF1232 domain-containing protein [Acidimicrobiia bacterium]
MTDRRSIRETVATTAAALPNLVKLLYRLVRDPRVPRRRKIFALAALGYVASPYDVLPDFIPVVGAADDVLLVVTALHFLLQAAGEEVVEEHWDGDDDVVELIADLAEWGADLLPGPVRAGLQRIAG